MKFRNLFNTIKSKIIGFNIILIFTLAVFFSWYFPSEFMKTEFINQRKSIESVCHVVAENSITAIEFNDESSLNNLINSIMVIEDVRQVGMYKESGELILKTDENNAILPIKTPDFFIWTGVEYQLLSDSIFQTSYPITVNGNNYGYIVVIASSGSAISTANQFRFITIIINLIILIVSSVFVGIFSKMAISPVIKVTTMMAELSEGSGNIHKRLPVTTQDEVGELIKEFNKLIDYLNNMLDTLQNKGIQMSVLSGELVKNLNSFSNAVMQQNNASTQTTTTIEELSVSITAISNNSQRVALIAENTKKATESGLTDVDDTVIRIRKINKDNTTVVEKLVELGKKSESISNILRVIDDINDQTQLIAFNAMIEAKGAGESGRRFMVVANEIKQLSENLNNKNKSIKNILDDISGFIDEVIRTNQQMIPTINLCVESGLKLTERLQTINQLASDSSLNMRQIYLATDQQSKAVNEVVSSIREISSGSSQFVEGSGRIRNVADKLNSIASEFN